VKEILKDLFWVLLAALVLLIIIIAIALSDPNFRDLAE
jgi:hypothetical protein